MTPSSDDFTKAAIKTRLTHKAAELWGYSEAEMEGFDPLVQMLMEACAVELEKIGQEIHGTQHRLVDRLASLLNPDVVDAPRPAHAVAQALPRETQAILPADAQFVYQRPAAGRQVTTRPVFFSPLQTTSLTHGRVRYLATDTTLWQLESSLQKRVVAQAPTAIPTEHRRLWIGLELAPEVTSLAHLSFYLDWANEPQRPTFTSFLPGDSWRLDETVLTVEPGLREDGPAETFLHQEYDFLQRVEQHVRAVYAPHFVRVGGGAAADLKAYVPRPYPAALAAQLPAAALAQLTQPLVWLEVRFSHALPPEALTNLLCATNCFPVLNRRLHKRLFRLQQALNIFPLDSEEPFLAMREVYSLNNVVYRSTSLTGLQDAQTDTYTLRTHGVGRFDARTGKQALMQLLELLRDESRAFTATGTDFISSTLRELNQNLARLEERLGRDAAAQNTAPYVLLRPQDINDSVYLEYWSSDGAAANRLAPGSRLQVYDGQYLDEVQLLTTTVGGQERPRPEERVHALRKNLLSRNRIVTLEDIKAACWAELGSQLAQVQVEKGFRNGTTPGAGFVRCIRVTLTPAAASRLSGPEWQQTAEDLQITLASQSAMNLPYEVLVKTQ
ncbi:type VI secretion system baseplate subunit TssF [Hymenobacter cellulosivorans]|uniref:Type VI secretion system baseplate subunit TssF n=1 Tax=Hymenobacter cellulosivorans TaxID=2932249 RepID=A0ABY4FKE7_9BACT|nr:type VI secretion system baseplate subunit TssF [Hymenobacter cellulosivorans]UOQ55541.1 type VI secretion system baseplate subunit TssF [Hymenobacter cellulosivorans]